jgi:hypothetical protein
MGKTSTRRSVSIMGTSYARLTAHCKAIGRSKSGLVEELIAAHLDALDVPEVAPEDLPPPYPNKRSDPAAIEAIRSAHFTF